MRKSHIVFIANKYTLILVMMERSGLCAMNVSAGFTLNALISFPIIIAVLFLTALNAKKYKYLKAIQLIGELETQLEMQTVKFLKEEKLKNVC